MTLTAVRFALDPTPRVEADLRRHTGAARFAFNWGLARVTANLAQREAEASYGIAEADRTPFVDWSFYGLRKDWNAAKAAVAPWWAECSKEAFSTGLDRLARALRAWSDSRRGKRRGPRVGFPRFRSRRTAAPSVRFTTGPLRAEGTHAVLPRIGQVKMHEPVGSRLDGARIVAATVRHERGRWHVAFTVDADTSRAPASAPAAVVGVDLGIKVLAALSTGEVIENPKHLESAQRTLARLSRRASRRRGPDRRTGQAPSNRWRRANAARAKAHHRVANLRGDYQHKVTAGLVARFGTIVVEDLHVAGMVRNRSLARQVSGCGWGEIRRQIEYKAEQAGGRVIVADRWFASSKTCSGCGAVKTKLLLSERTYACSACGLVCDRDENAARNLAGLAGSGPDSNGRGGDRKTGLARQVPVKRQPGARRRGETGTGTEQSVAAS